MFKAEMSVILSQNRCLGTWKWRANNYENFDDSLMMDVKIRQKVFN